MTNAAGVGSAPNPKRTGAVATWIRASRPYSFVAATMPTFSALALALRDSGSFRIAPAACCVFFALFGQVAANLLNDFSDYRTGANPGIRAANERNGRVNRRTLRVAGWTTLAIAVLFGLATIPYGGETIVVVGVIFSAICVLYSLGPFPLSERGLGDAAVFLTFGVGSVVFTYFLQTQAFSYDALALGAVYGLAVNNILVANNYADYEEDRAIGKYTTVVIFGERFGRIFYLVSGLIAIAVLAVFYASRRETGFFALLSLAFYGVSLIRAYLTLCRAGYQKEVGLAQAGMSVTLLGILVPLAILL